MQAYFSTFQVTIALDAALLAITVAATYYTLQVWAGLRISGTALGVALILAGVWLHTVMHVFGVADLLDPRPSGATETPIFRQHNLPSLKSWVASTGSVALVAIGLLALMRNVLQQFRTQSQLLADAEQRERRLQNAADMAKLGFYIYDTAADRVVFCTEQHAASHGVSKAEYLQKASSLSNEMPLIHPDDREMMREKYREVSAGKTVELEYRVPTKAGERRVREITTPVFDSKGNVISEMGTSQDVTDQRETEARLQRSQKVEAIGNLTGGVAHDFNNLLAVILGNLELAKEDPANAEELLDQAILATLKGADLTKSMLSFARRAPLAPAVLDLNQIVLQTKNWAARTLPSSIGVETSLLAGLWPVMADRSSTESALLNLFLNARDAMPDGGRLTIETANLRVDEDYIEQRREDLELGRYVMLAVSDTGNGIGAEIVERIFDPFFTTKEPGKGTGLGLSMIQGFMKQSGGTVRVYSEPGYGSTFKLFFPAHGRSEDREPLKSDEIQDLGAGEGQVVLVAEDEAEVMLVLEKVLKGAGYTVISAMSGDAALGAFQAAEKVDVVLTDIVMPGVLQGPGLVQALRQIDPNIPAVFMSGYASEATVHGNGLLPNDIRLMKPVSRRNLLAAVKQALARQV